MEILDILDAEVEEVQDFFANLDINGESFDLSDKNDAYEALDIVREYRQQLRNDELEEYEDRDTDFGGGGRTRLLHDELRAHLAVGFHKGEHDLTFEEQEAEAERIISIRAIQTRHRWR